MAIPPYASAISTDLERVPMPGPEVVRSACWYAEQYLRAITESELFGEFGEDAPAVHAVIMKIAKIMERQRQRGSEDPE